MSRPQGREAITRGIMNSRNPRQTIIRRRKREQEPRQTIIWVRKCEPNFGQAITRGWMGQTERGAGYLSVVTAVGARVIAPNNHLRNTPYKNTATCHISLQNIPDICRHCNFIVLLLRQMTKRERSNCNFSDSRATNRVKIG